MTHDLQSIIHSSVHKAIAEVAAHPTLNVGVSVPKQELTIEKSVKNVEEKAVRTGLV